MLKSLAQPSDPFTALVSQAQEESQFTNLPVDNEPCHLPPMITAAREASNAEKLSKEITINGAETLLLPEQCQELRLNKPRRGKYISGSDTQENLQQIYFPSPLGKFDWLRLEHQHRDLTEDEIAWLKENRDKWGEYASEFWRDFTECDKRLLGR